MKIKPLWLIITAISTILLWVNCKQNVITIPDEDIKVSGTTFVEASSQRTGDATKGYDYLVNGGYVSSGIPLNIFKFVYPTDPDDLGRTGDGKGIPYAYNAVTDANGFKMASPNCLSCHADKLNGQVIVGLGNTTADNTIDRSVFLKQLDNVVQLQYPKGSAGWKAYEPFTRGFSTIAPYIRTQVQGVSSADKVFAALSAYRKADDLSWLPTPQFNLAIPVVPTDVPAWWLMKKKNALYYNTSGHGDLAKQIMATSLVTMVDSTEARKIEQRFPDVLAFLKSVQAPKNPNPIDQTLVEKGKPLFAINCAKCHGRYDSPSTYPNLLVDLPTIGTDAAAANEYNKYPDYHTWYNGSWFSKGAFPSQLLPKQGYIAPPLDGIWATAPYLHNGSVPTLDDLLNSSQRPKLWSRTFDNTADYDVVKIGWKYKTETTKVDIKTYDTSLYGYGNGGHYYGDKFTADERKAVIEYLKTL